MSYIDLLTGFIEGEIPILDFEEKFNEKFKNEKSFKSEEEFHALDELFGDLDCYHPAIGLLFDPEEDLTEDQIRDSVRKAVYALQQL